MRRSDAVEKRGVGMCANTPVPKYRRPLTGTSIDGSSLQLVDYQKKVEGILNSCLLRVILILEVFPNFSTFILFARFFNLSYFLRCFYPNIGMVTNVISLLPESFTMNDITPTSIDTYLQLITVEL